MRKPSPCKGCDNRLVGCHSLCPDYKAWRKEWDERERENYADKPDFPKALKKHVYRKMMGR